MLPRLDGVGGMRIDGISENLAASTGSSLWLACDLGEGPRATAAGCAQVGRGTEGIVCLETERGGTGPCTRRREVGGERRGIIVAQGLLGK